MTLSLAYSPCPNDCFIFDAMIHQRVDTEGLDFDVKLEDVETLNTMALRSQCDITKLSFHAYAYCIKDYILLRSGSALGFNCGPILLTRPENMGKSPDEMNVAIPGKMTTANFLLSLAFPNIRKKTEMVFSEIEDAVLSGKVDAGLIIHENRFTFEAKGLKKLLDLGEYWDQLVHAPIPLGGIFVRRQLEDKLKQKIDRVIRRSVEFAFAHPEAAMPYVKENAQEMSESVMKKHIALYVNQFSRDLGESGVKAVQQLFSTAKEKGLFEVPDVKLVMDQQLI